MTKRRLRLAYCVLAAVLAAPLALGVKAQNAPAQQPAPPAATPDAPPADQTPVFRTDINFVRVDVIVNDRQGNPVERSEAGGLRSHRGREAAVGPDVQADQRQRGHRPRQRSAARSAQRHRRADGGGARRCAAVRDFSRRLPRAAREQHARARGDRAVRREPAAARRTWRASCTRCGRSTTCCCRGTEGRSRARFESSRGGSTTTRRATPSKSGTCTMCRPIEAERIRNQVTLTALKGLIVRLGGLREGRKAIILVSEGFTNALPAQVNDQIATCNGGACGNQPRARPDPVGGANSPMQQRMESQEFFLQTDLLSDLRMVYELANRYNTAIYAVDPRGLAPFEFDLSTAGQAAVSLTKNHADARQHDGHAAHPRRRNRRPRHPEYQRSRQRAAPDRARLERVLPAGLHLCGDD